VLCNAERSFGIGTPQDSVPTMSGTGSQIRDARRTSHPHARHLALRLAESYLTGSLFRQILHRIERLAGHPTGSRAGRSEGGEE